MARRENGTDRELVEGYEYRSRSKVEADIEGPQPPECVLRSWHTLTYASSGRRGSYAGATFRLGTPVLERAIKRVTEAVLSKMSKLALRSPEKFERVGATKKATD
jgi:hypothetical protein